MGTRCSNLCCEHECVYVCRVADYFFLEAAKMQAVGRSQRDPKFAGEGKHCFSVSLVYVPVFTLICVLAVMGKRRDQLPPLPKRFKLLLDKVGLFSFFLFEDV